MCGQKHSYIQIYICNYINSQNDYGNKDAFPKNNTYMYAQIK